MDQKNDAMARIEADRQFTCRSPKEIGGIPHLPPQAQAATCRAKSEARDKFQHFADEITTQQ